MPVTIYLFFSKYERTVFQCDGIFVVRFDATHLCIRSIHLFHWENSNDDTFKVWTRRLAHSHRWQFDLYIWFSFIFIFFLEENEKPADLQQRVIFKSKRSQNTDHSDEGKETDLKEKSKKRPEPVKNKLSFQDDEDDEDDE